MKPTPNMLHGNRAGVDLRGLPGVASPFWSQRRRAQGGYVLLGLLFMTAVLAVGLALSLPRAAMQAQRVREERLIYRGEQYKRGIQLYFRKYKKYPASIDDLEETNGERFLRRRYIDPITGKDQWRLVHMGNDGRFSDSLIHDKQEEGAGPRGVGGSQPSAPIGSAAAQATDPSIFVSQDGRLRGADRARAQRYSAAPDIPGQAGSSGLAFLPNGQNAANGDPGQQPDPNDPYAVTGADPSGAPANTPNQPQPGQYPGYSRMPTSQVPNQGQAMPVPAVPFGVPQQQQQQAAQSPRYRIGNPTPAGNAPGAQPQPGMRPAAFGTQGVGNQATQIISNLLTRPRPGGLSGIVPQQAQQQSAFAGGLAGVASEAEDRGVKVYQGFEQYNQWEFVYDYRQDRSFGGTPVGPQAAPPAQDQGLQAGQPGVGASGGLTVTPGSIPGVPVGVPYQQPGMPGAPIYQTPPSTFGQPGAGGQGTNPMVPVPIDPVTGQPIEQPIDPNQQDPNQQDPNQQDPYQQGNPQDPAAPPAPNAQPNIRGFPPGMFPFPGQGPQQRK